MNHCYVLDCDPDWEETVSFELKDFGIKHYLAMESRSVRMGRKGGKQIAIEVPMLPGIIFVWGELYELFNLRHKIRHIDGIWVARAGTGVPVHVPQTDLERFRSEVENYLITCRASIAKGQRPPAKPAKLAINLGELKEHKTQVLHRLGFGIVERETT